MRRSLVTEGAPDGTRPCGVDGCRLRRGWRVPGAKVRGASGRGLLGRDSRQRGVLALGLVVGALGKPYACAQAAMRCTQAGSLAYFARVGGSLAAGFFSASRFEIFLRKFLEFQQLVVSLANTLVNVFGLACSSFSLSCCNFISFLHFDFDQIYFPHRSSSDVRTSCASCTAGCWRTMFDLKLFELAS